MAALNFVAAAADSVVVAVVAVVFAAFCVRDMARDVDSKAARMALVVILVI